MRCRIGGRGAGAPEEQGAHALVPCSLHPASRPCIPHVSLLSRLHGRAALRAI